MSRRGLAAGALIVACAFMAYGATFDNYFVQDDFGVVSLLSQKPAGYFPRWFVTSWMDEIWGYVPDEVRPFVAVTYQVAAIFGPSNPWPNHIINVAFHAGTALLVWSIARHAARLCLVPATLAGVVFVVLPNGAETAAWITGRVDSMPAFFYLASFLAWVRWRRNGHRSAYVWSIVWCFVALLSKQNTITLVPALVLYDVLCDDVVDWRTRWTSVAAWFVYLPHIILTTAYLGLRYLLFGEVARESLLNSTRIGYFLDDASRHLMRVILGAASPSDTVFWIIGLAAALLAAGWWLARTSPRSPETPSLLRSALYFGPVWMVLALAPTLMSTYASSRHAYLASCGWALVVGIAVEAGWRTQDRRARMSAAAAAALLVGLYGVQLARLIVEWDERAAVAFRAVVDIHDQALAMPRGTLILAGVPARSFNFSLPFAAKPPFAGFDVTSRARLVFHSALYCCAANLWEPYTRRTLQAWLDDPAQPPVVGMSWDPRTGQLFRVTESEDPSLRTLMRLLASTGDQVALDGTIDRVIRDVIALHPARDSGRQVHPSR